MTIRAEESDAICSLDAEMTQGARQTANALRKLCIRKAILIADYCGPAGILLFRIAKEAKRREGNIHSVPRLDQAD
jgi:hypothetical protein